MTKKELNRLTKQQLIDMLAEQERGLEEASQTLNDATAIVNCANDAIAFVNAESKRAYKRMGYDNILYFVTGGLFAWVLLTIIN